MITIRDVQQINKGPTTLDIVSEQELEINASHLTLFPGLIDPHVHFRTPGLEAKENWISAAKASIKGGYTTVFDMPNTLPPTVTAKDLHQKKALINQQLRQVNIPLRYGLFFGADKNHLDQIALVVSDIVGIKVFMGCSTGNLVIDDDQSLREVFKIAAQYGLIVAVHAEDESLLQHNKTLFPLPQNYPVHSQIRNPKAAEIAVKKAISMARNYGTTLYVLHVSCPEEIQLIAEAKNEGLSVYAEATPHHLFLNDQAYEQLQGKGVVNPPLRTSYAQAQLWIALNDGIIDTIGSDHAPHTQAEKQMEYGQCPSGMPGIETTLPLLLTAYHQDKISLKRIIELTYHNPQKLFKLESYNDWVLVDLEKKQKVSSENLQTKCSWSAFEGQTLKGWPIYTILANHCYKVG